MITLRATPLLCLVLVLAPGCYGAASHGVQSGIAPTPPQFEDVRPDRGWDGEELSQWLETASKVWAEKFPEEPSIRRCMARTEWVIKDDVGGEPDQGYTWCPPDDRRRCEIRLAEVQYEWEIDWVVAHELGHVALWCAYRIPHPHPHTREHIWPKFGPEGTYVFEVRKRAPDHL